MKRTRLNREQAVLIAIATFVCITARADFVYNNSSNDLNLRFDIGAAEAGDEIVLASGGRSLTNFSFEYWAEGLHGGEQGHICFYKNDGPAAPAGPTIYEPGTLLFDSGLFTIHNTARLVLTWSDFVTGADTALTSPVPDSFTWTIQFYGVDSGAGEHAGVDLYSLPVVGSNYKEYWNNDGGGWTYNSLTNGVGDFIDVNFGATVGAVPEPTAVLLGLVGGLGLLGLQFRRRKP